MENNRRKKHSVKTLLDKEDRVVIRDYNDYSLQQQETWNNLTTYWLDSPQRPFSEVHHHLQWPPPIGMLVKPCPPHFACGPQQAASNFAPPVCHHAWNYQPSMARTLGNRLSNIFSSNKYLKPTVLASLLLPWQGNALFGYNGCSVVFQ